MRRAGKKRRDRQIVAAYRKGDCSQREIAKREKYRLPRRGRLIDDMPA